MYMGVLKVAFLCLYICAMETLRFYNQPLMELTKMLQLIETKAAVTPVLPYAANKN